MSVQQFLVDTSPSAGSGTSGSGSTGSDRGRDGARGSGRGGGDGQGGDRDRDRDSGTPKSELPGILANLKSQIEKSGKDYIPTSQPSDAEKLNLVAYWNGADPETLSLPIQSADYKSLQLRIFFGRRKALKETHPDSFDPDKPTQPLTTYVVASKDGRADITARVDKGAGLAENILQDASTFGGIGNTIGTAVPGIGNAIGTAVGVVVGTGVALIEGADKGDRFDGLFNRGMKKAVERAYPDKDVINQRYEPEFFSPNAFYVNGKVSRNEVQGFLENVQQASRKNLSKGGENAQKALSGMESLEMFTARYYTEIPNIKDKTVLFMFEPLEESKTGQTVQAVKGAVALGGLLVIGSLITQ
jgi:hypothetical protein